MQNIEKTYKSKLENYELPVSNDVWGSISSALIKKKKRRRLYLIYLASVILLLSIAIGIYYLNAKKNTSKSKLDKTSQTAKLSNTKSNHIIATNSDEQQKKFQNDKINLNDDGKQSLTKLSSNSSNIKTVKNNFNRQSNVNNKTSDSDINEIKSNNKIIGIKHSMASFDKTDVDNLDSFSNQKNPELNRSELKKSNNKIKSFDVVKNKEISLLKISNNKIKSFFKKNKHNGILNDCFPIKVNSWIVEGYLSPDFNLKRLNGANKELIDLRTKTESVLFSYSAGLRFGYLFSNGFVIKTGLNYTIINEKFHILFKNIISTQTIITIDTIVNQDGTITEVRDTTIKEVYGEKDIQKSNSYRMLDIPLIVGFEYKKYNHRFGINLGVIFNIVTSQDVHILDSSGVIKSYSKGNDIFHENLGISIYSSVLYSYRIKSRYELFVEPKIRYYLKPFTKSNYALEQKYTKFGISFGSRYLF